MNLHECIEDGLLRKIAPDKALSGKEWSEAQLDLNDAVQLFEEKRFKRSTTAAYYAMFHAAKAVLFQLGYKENAHYAISVVLDDLVKQGKLESTHANDFRAALHARQQADYHYDYSKQNAAQVVEVAREFVKRIEKLLK